jgi:8-oxo-dGTP pyrophosphatase MutT (NUDIX family)
MNSSKPSSIPKVSIFVIDHDDRLLVFEHSDIPSAGVQVPAGTIERGEPSETAALRELCEETGKQSFEIMALVARRYISEIRHGREEFHDRWFFRASPTQQLPEEWVFGESTPTGWIPFRFYWINRSSAELLLTPDHAEVYRLTSAEQNPE